MTVSSTTARQTYIGDGSLATYPYNFRIFDAGDLVLVKRNTSTGSETPMFLGVDYTVTGAGSYSGGTFTLTAGVLAAGYTVAAYRELDLLQQTDLRNQGYFLAETHERVFDRLVMADQQLQDQLNRSLRLPDSEAGGSTFKLPTLELRRGKQLAFDPDTGLPIAEAKGTPSAASVTLLELAASAKPWFNVMDPAYGAVGNGVIDDMAAINAAILACNAAGGGRVYVPPGTYRTTSSISMKSNVTLYGDGAASIIQMDDANPYQGVEFVDCDNAEVCNLKIIGNGSVSGYATGGHGVRVDGSINCAIRDCNISDTTGYGIGVAGGANIRLRIERCYIHQTGRDGIDLKDKLYQNKDISIRSCLIVQHDRASLGGQAGIDLRGGPVTVSDCVVVDYGDTGTDDVGIRCRFGEEDVSVNGRGAHYASITNCRSKAVDNASAAFGFNLGGRGVRLVNCVAIGCPHGIAIGQEQCTVDGCTIVDCNVYGVWLQEQAPTDELPTSADKTVVTGLQFITNTFASGTAAAGAASTITMDGDASSADDAYVEYYVTITGGTGAGQSKKITDYNGTTKVATVSGTFSPAPDATSTYRVTTGGSPVRIESDNNIFSNCILQGANVSGVYAARQLSPGVGSLFANWQVKDFDSKIQDATASLKVQNIVGVESQARGSATIPVDSTTAGSVAYTHGLGFTPSIDSVLLTLQEVSNVSDFVVAYLRVSAVSSTTITFKYKMATASATGGATAKVNVYASAKSP